MRINIENYVVFLIAGLFPWQRLAFDQHGADGLVGKRLVDKKSSFPP